MAKSDNAREGASKATIAPDQWAIKSARAVMLFLVILIAALAADLLSKHYVFESLLNDPALVAKAEAIRSNPRLDPDTTSQEMLTLYKKPVVWGLTISLSTNPGAVFGWSIPPWVVIITTVVTVALVGVFFATSDKRAWSIHLSLAFILAGALGNLYDRLFSYVQPLAEMEPIRRNVRDFIDCSDLYWKWIFNVADMLLVIGVGVLALHWIAAERARKATDDKKASKAV